MLWKAKGSVYVEVLSTSKILFKVKETLLLRQLAVNMQS